MLLALVPPDAVIRGPNLPPPPEGLYALAPLVLGLLVLSVLYWIRLRRVRASSRRRGGILASFALSVALGNALVELGAVLDASRPVAMVMERGDCDRDVERVGDGRHGQGSHRTSRRSNEETTSSRGR
jgi:hypothetical protein